MEIQLCDEDVSNLLPPCCFDKPLSHLKNIQKLIEAK
jgi:hypothetical protein